MPCSHFDHRPPESHRKDGQSAGSGSLPGVAQSVTSSRVLVLEAKLGRRTYDAHYHGCELARYETGSSKQCWPLPAGLRPAGLPLPL